MLFLNLKITFKVVYDSLNLNSINKSSYSRNMSSVLNSIRTFLFYHSGFLGRVSSATALLLHCHKSCAWNRCATFNLWFDKSALLCQAGTSLVIVFRVRLGLQQIGTTFAFINQFLTGVLTSLLFAIIIGLEVNFWTFLIICKKKS